jgi:hypothetical protein
MLQRSSLLSTAAEATGSPVRLRHRTVSARERCSNNARAIITIVMGYY